MELAGTACGARSELMESAPGCTSLSIGILGNPGAYDAMLDYDQWLVAGGAGVQRLETTPDEPLTATTLAPFNVVVLDWLTRDYSPEEAASFGAWVEAGGGVVSMSGFDNVMDRAPLRGAALPARALGAGVRVARAAEDVRAETAELIS
jgi:hypothetical protein